MIVISIWILCDERVDGNNNRMCVGGQVTYESERTLWGNQGIPEQYMDKKGLFLY